ncbi:putative bifunctional diguanylate cyclase/phosphodiesterase [Pigmentiphaga kullae]|uniref:Diguanylate cyclase (GGDEF)-like protein n=1 Tax=Pigmentiphaga kullae TaxID=151784 RepID=A0A4Q7NEX3_9BURK|nr:EAL domain-containing protein [Pigmentiphaga kullae]RZS81573.1 diguanylate cyclase (GGDEF)-like protein [Pigmentiphaga kullae]
MHGVYNPLLVFLSLVVASLAAYTALELTGRIASLPGWKRRLPWLVGGAVAMGVGIWSMHFIGMMAFSLPIPLGYTLGPTVLSLLIAVLVSGFALAVSASGRFRFRCCMAGGVAMGMGIAGMHYMGMAALDMAPAVSYVPWIVLASVGLAIAASVVALWLGVALRGSDEPYIAFKRLGAALVMGIAITGMHYTGMSAAQFAPGSVCLSASQIDPNWLAMLVSGSSLAVLLGTLLVLGWRANSLADSLRLANRQLQYLSMHDALTGLPNRLMLIEQMNQAIQAADRDKTAFAVFFLDLDGFKTVNDSLGHAVGDDLLKGCAQLLSSHVRKDDLVARIGGDEFVILLRGISAPGDAASVAKKLLRVLRDDMVGCQARLRIGASMGIAMHPGDARDSEALLDCADAAMYSAKQAGRNTYCFFEPGMHANAARTLMLQQDLEAALEEGQFSLVFQPKFSVATRAICGAEALIRWHHPTFGSVAPMEFITVAERSGQIVQIGDWVIREVCRCIDGWRRRGLEPVQISINLSPIQFNVPDLIGRVEDILDEREVPRRLVMFEITETVAMLNAGRTAEIVSRFRARGFDMAIDDFGAGYSSLAYLHRFKVKQIKVDRLFTSELDRNEAEARALLSAIVTLSHALHMEVVAEGVESEKQMRFLIELGCDEAQGFLLAHPLSEEAFRGLLQPMASFALRRIAALGQPRRAD